jgi:hypothetical protein
MSASKESVNVSRSYEPVSEDCVKALALLLRVPVHNKAARPAPEPDGCDGTKSKEDSANGILSH